MRATQIPHHVLLSAFMSDTPDHVYFKDLELRFILLSKSLAKYFNRTVDEMVGLKDEDLFDAKQARAFREVELEIIRTGKGIVDRVVRHVLPNGKVSFSLNTSQLILDECGRHIGLWGTNKDITQAKITED